MHKLVTGRREMFTTLRQAEGLSGYPSRAESVHDWVENSHASTALCYAHGLAAAVKRSNNPNRNVVAVVGDGALTGGMAYEGLNNLGHSDSRVIVILNDNGRSYAPTVSRLSEQPYPVAASPWRKFGQAPGRSQGAGSAESREPGVLEPAGFLLGDQRSH